MTISSLLDFLGNNINILIILLFAGIPLYIGSAAATRSINTEADYFLCNRQLPTLPAFCTIYATWWSSFAFLSSTSSFYFTGAVYWIALGWNVLFALLFMGIGKKAWAFGKDRNYRTLIDFLDSRYHSPSLNILAIIITVSTMIPYMMVQFVGGGIVIELATGSLLPWRVCVLIFFMIMVIYLWFGGLRSVVWTDILYATMIFGGMLSAGYIFVRMTGGVSNMFQTIGETGTDAFALPDVIGNTNGYGFWISLLILMPVGEIMMPQIWTRMFAIKSETTFHLLPFFLSVATIAYLGSMLAGNSARVLMPSYTGKSDYILPTLLIHYTPGVIMSIIMCCIVAASLSTVNSQLHSLSQVLTQNLFKTYIRPQATEKYTVRVAKVTTLGIAVVTYTLIMVYDLNTIFDFTLLAFGCMAQLIVPACGALFWHKYDGDTAIGSLLCGVVITLALAILKPVIFPVHPCIIGLLVNGLVYYISCSLKYRSMHVTRTVTKSEEGRRTRIAVRRMEVLWLLIAACFLLMASPLVVWFGRNHVQFLGFPAIYSFVFLLWVILCVLCFVGYLFRWRNRS